MANTAPIFWAVFVTMADHFAMAIDEVRVDVGRELCWKRGGWGDFHGCCVWGYGFGTDVETSFLFSMYDTCVGRGWSGII
jgi:hypothetical protein